MDEAGLIAAARMGDQDAFTRLYQLHVAYVKAVGRALLHRTDLEDFCQDTFLRAFTRLDSFAGNAQFRTWLTRIAVNQCHRTLKKELQASNGEAHLVQLDEDFACDDSTLEAVGARLDLDKLLAVLTPGQRRVLEMAYLEDMPDQEIAAELDMTLISVKCKIYQAKQKVRKEDKKT
jgi:RNA polymerase sigma-70 factor (ECF subfamily)